MSEAPLLSIIMPCFNGEGTLRRALDSVFSQDVDFDYEVLVVDDGSTDGSIGIVKEYAEKQPEIRIIDNGSNLGNAMAFYNGISNSRGKYYCVLDVDDYYTIRDKLSRQIRFLEKDLEEEYVAATHHYLIDLGGGNVCVPDVLDVSEFNYDDIINQRCGYYHTATYVYRNTFRNSIPALFMEDRFRGDTVRTIAHLMYTNKKVKVLNYVGSAYFWSEDGIWSSLDQKKQFDRQTGIWEGLKDISRSAYEKNAFDILARRSSAKRNEASKALRKYPSATIGHVLDLLEGYASKYAFENREFVFRGLYYSEYLDSAATSMGTVFRIYNEDVIQKDACEDVICILVTTLKPRGGGIFREIVELAGLYPDKKVYLISTEKAESDKDAAKILSKVENLEVIFINASRDRKLMDLHKTIKAISPSKTYFYNPHNDLYISAVLQDGPGKNVCMFSYDHGFVCNLSCSNADTILSKRPSDYEMLKKAFGEKVIYVPAWNEYKPYLDNLKYAPFDGHSEIITACGAARFSKLEAGPGMEYLVIVMNLLAETGGQHVHFGPIPSEWLSYVNQRIVNDDLREDAFVHVEWSEDPLRLMFDKKVDLFIETFPTVSYKITIDMLMGGIPIISYCGNTRMSTVDFIYGDNMAWIKESDLIEKIKNVSAETLLEHSGKSKEYFNTTHHIDAMRRYFVTETSFETLPRVKIVDGQIHDIRGFEKIFSNGAISLYTAISGNKEIRTNQHAFESGGGGVGIRSLLIDAKALFLRYARNWRGEFDSRSVSQMFNSNSWDENKKAFFTSKMHASKNFSAAGWLARAYRDGKGVGKNRKKALKWMKKAALGDEADFKMEYADMMLSSDKPSDKSEAVFIYRTLMDEGFIWVSGRLARAYRDGNGVEKDLDTAIEYMEMAMEKKIGWARLELADMLMDRASGDDSKRAFLLYAELVERGSSAAIGRLARAYRDGNGVEKDLDTAIEYMEMAAERNIEWAESELQDLIRLKKARIL